MINPKNLSNFLIFDLETVHGHYAYQELDPIMQKHWARRAKRLPAFDPQKLENPDDPSHADPHFEALYYDQAAIHAEFGRVVCATVGSLKPHEDGWQLYHRSYVSDREEEVLEGFSAVLNNHITKLPQPETNPKVLCGHNVKGFDMPYLCRRLVINGMSLPTACNIANLKPWEMRHLVDTMELWRFGDFKSFAPLELLTQVLGIPSPKADMDGANVSHTFWEEQDYQKIATYCEQDVLATAQLVLKFAGQPLIETHNIISKTAEST
jgi:DNA polymerase elongation subunit (family B)